MDYVSSPLRMITHIVNFTAGTATVSATTVLLYLRSQARSRTYCVVVSGSLRDRLARFVVIVIPVPRRHGRRTARCCCNSRRRPNSTYRTRINDAIKFNKLRHGIPSRYAATTTRLLERERAARPTYQRVPAVPAIRTRQCQGSGYSQYTRCPVSSSIVGRSLLICEG